MRASSKPKVITVPCDACRYEIGEECHKCSGSGVICIYPKKKDRFHA